MMKLWLELALVLLVVIDRQSPYIFFTNVLRVCVCLFIYLLLMQLPRVECQRVSGENRKGGIYRDALSTSRTFMRLF